MSILDKFANVWAETGDTGLTPTAEKISSGFVRKDKPAWQRLNRLFNRSEKKIQDLITEGPMLSDPDSTTNVQQMLTTGLWDHNWADTDSSVNKMDGGAGTTFVFCNVFFTSDSEPRIIAIDAATNVGHVFNPRTLASVETTGDLSAGLPTPTTSWAAESICTDGTYIYTVWFDAGAPDLRITAHLISDWSVHTGWPASGTSIGSGSSGATLAQAILISSTQLAVTNSALSSITASSSAAIRIINLSDGSIDSSGAGDAPTGSSLVPAGRIATDGTNLFFTAKGGGNHYLCTATIADLTTGTGGTGYPLNYGATLNCELCSMGDVIVSSPTWSVTTNGDYIMYTHSASESIIFALVRGSTISGSAGVKAYLDNTWGVMFDGMNVWIFGNAEQHGLDGNTVFIKIDAAKITGGGYDYSVVAQTIPEVAEGVYMMSDASGTINNGCIFDGRDIWFSDYTQYIKRLPLASLRS